MAGFVYYVPGAAGLSPDKLDALGIGKQLGRAAQYRQGQGPDGGGGCFATFPGHPFTAYNETQTWRKAGKDGAWWIGFLPEDRPAPEDLRRDFMVPSHAVQMGDNQRWQVPICRVFPDVLRRMDLNEKGEVVSVIMEDFRELSARVGNLWAHYRDRINLLDTESSQDVLQFSLELEDYDLITDALAINYWVGRWEVAVLGLLSGMAIQQSIEALLDIAGIIEMQKKNPPCAASGSNGGRGV